MHVLSSFIGLVLAVVYIHVLFDRKENTCYVVFVISSWN
jgi:hypothetical protein